MSICSVYMAISWIKQISLSDLSQKSLGEKRTKNRTESKSLLVFLFNGKINVNYETKL